MAARSIPSTGYSHPRATTAGRIPLFDRRTGVIDPAVAQYWREHYDIAAIIARDWKTLKPDLDGKIHLIVGTDRHLPP